MEIEWERSTQIEAEHSLVQMKLLLLEKDPTSVGVITPFSVSASPPRGAGFDPDERGSEIRESLRFKSMTFGSCQSRPPGTCSSIPWCRRRKLRSEPNAIFRKSLEMKADVENMRVRAAPRTSASLAMSVSRYASFIEQVSGGIRWRHWGGHPSGASPVPGRRDAWSQSSDDVDPDSRPAEKNLLLWIKADPWVHCTAGKRRRSLRRPVRQ